MLNFPVLKTRIPFFLHPLPLGAALLMAVNDHYLKYLYPGVLTGKLSDFLGCFYFPLLILGIVVIAEASLNLRTRLSFRTQLLICILLTDVLFLSVKISPVWKEWIVMHFSRVLFPISVTTDPTDLIALSMNPLTYLWGKKHAPKE